MCVKLFAGGEIKVSDVAFIIMACWSVIRQFRILGETYNNTIKDYMEAKQAWEEMITPYAVTDKPGARNLVVRRGAVELRGISFKYDRDWVLHGLSLDIKPGERIGVIGLSGAGKTTLVHLLLRPFDVQAGGIFIDGRNIRNVQQESLRRNIAFVPQDPALFNRTLAENIGYARPDATQAQIERAAKQADIHGFIMSARDGYGTVVGNRGIKLSGGQRQRIAIARAILKDAPILILDEATSSLDSQTEATIQKSFHALMKGRATVVIAHRLSTLRKMDRIIVIEKGSIAEQGSHAGLLKKNGIYARLWKKQAGNKKIHG
ncbi:MAG: ATP-binding cassette domain-containing protein [Alphaproteobacteria bacterium]|nr:ATP-binding cassette domain-containing protein [Alphaproteobacteria bacterium]